MMKLHKILLLYGWLVACLPCVSSCNNDMQEDVPVAINTPLVISAEIESGQTEDADTRATVAADNGYDRSTFVAGDKINVICSRQGSRLSSAGYSLAADGVWKVNEDNALGFLPAITCRAEFPVDYDVVMTDQSTTAAFLKSNLLRTPEVPVTGAEVKFAGDNAFVHQHAKVTLNFKGANTQLPAFKQITLSGTGICSGTSKAESITPLRPNPGEDSWCVVLNASLGSDSDIKVTVVDENNITYQSGTVVAKVETNKHYTISITLQNNILYPVGQEIKPWTTVLRHTGSFDTN